MSRIRDIASILTSANVLSTDVETSAAITAAINALPPGYGRGNTASRPASPTLGDIYVNTQTGFVEIYESTGWSQVGGAASVVTGVTATNTPTSRAYNNGSASIAFTPGTILGKTYTVTSSPGSYTASGSVSPITITGLQSSTQYTYTVVAANNYSTAAASSASSAVTATTVPQAPSISSVTGGNAQVSVAFSANATGGSSITGYTVTSSPGGLTATGSSSPLVVTGLTNGTAYTFTAVATNTNGSSVASSASSSVTPVESIIADILVVAGGGGGQSTYYSGGGGAGGLRGILSQTLSPTISYTATIGSGGSSAPSNNYIGGSKGINSSFSGTGLTTINATGGGGGGGYDPNGSYAANTYNGKTGGSGGGASAPGDNYNFTGGAGNEGGYSPVEGYAGGNSDGRDGGYAGAGGGGGAGGAGQAGKDITNGAYAGAGGIGSSSYSTWGSATSSGQDVSGTYYYAGGGGGGYLNSASGAGGSGGGGGGANSSSATAGTQNTGGGGGGTGSGASNYIGGSGGSGIIILRISGSKTASATTGSPTRYETGGYTYYKFNNTGSITF